MKRFLILPLMLALVVAPTLQVRGADTKDYPPGWMPIQWFEPDATWDDDDPVLRNEKVHIYMPDKSKPVDGVFVCLVFTSPDPREFAEAWNFALVTIPVPHTYDIGDIDRRNKRRELGHEPQGMALLLRYLDDVGKASGHPELSTVPIVGWLGQAGPRYCSDLLKVAPERVIAWADGFPSIIRKHPEMTRQVPFAYAWEVNQKGKVKETGNRVPHRNNPPVFDDLSSAATTYSFKHGIYSKYFFFMSFLDRCIKLRMPDKTPPPGKPVKLKPVRREDGWVGDFMPIGEWNPIAPAGSEEAKSFAHPAWFPDAYAAHMWRAYHTGTIDPKKPYLDALSIQMVEPFVPYSRTVRGPRAGAGYGAPLSPKEAVTFAVDVTVDCKRVEYYDGDQKLGEVSKAPWKLEGVRLQTGLRAIYAVVHRPDGSQAASRCCFAIVKQSTVQPGE